MVFFCVFLRWERFIERYTITYLALLCPMIAILLNTLLLEKENWGNMLAGILIFMSLSELVNMIPYHYSESNWENGNRSIEYFHNWKEEKYEVYEEIAEYIKLQQYASVGLKISENSYEYPLWALLSDMNIIINGVTVENETSIYEDADFIPDCIFVDKEAGIEEYEYHGINYVHINVGDDYTYLLVREN